MNGLMEIAPAEAVAENVSDSCSLDNYLAQPDNTMDARIAAAREKLGKDVVLLGAALWTLGESLARQRT